MNRVPTLPPNALLTVVAWILQAALLLCGPASLRASDADGEGAATGVDFSHDIAPIFQKRCAKCHSGTQKKGGFSINTRQSMIAGGEGGPAIVAKRSGESELIDRVDSSDPLLRMPPEGERLTPAQIDLLKRWIDEGLPWEDGFAFGKSFRQAPLDPRRPEVPSGRPFDSIPNPIDRFVARYSLQKGFAPPPPVTDLVFARRAYFDLVGLPPSAEQLAEFAAEKRADKHGLLIDRLLDDKPAYTAHWLTFWNDLLRNAYHGTGFIDGGRKQITGWLYRALYENKPYDRFVHELIRPVVGSGSEGFTYGIKWRGTVNESQRREIQAAQSISQVFLGTNLKCASCHDSFVNHWKLSEAYALASVFAEGPLELYRCDQPTGVAAKTAYLYPQLGEIDGAASRDVRVARLADLMVDPRNGRLARTIVNRLWARLFGRGLVEPLDNMDAEPWDQDLLDYLASDLVDHGYDLKRTLRLMAGSRAYRLPGAISPTDTGEEFVFRGPLVKRFMAEQFVDSVFTLTGAWPPGDGSLTTIDGRGQGGQLGAVARALAAMRDELPPASDIPLQTARWIWSNAAAAQGAPQETVYFRKTAMLEQRPRWALATFTADNSFELFVNGRKLAGSDNWFTPVLVEIAGALAVGTNVISVKATNGGESSNPAGLIGEITLLAPDGSRVGTIATDDSWHFAADAPPDWNRPDFDDSAWKKAVPLGDWAIAPWSVAERVQQSPPSLQSSSQLPASFRIRASLLSLDSLQSALGRPSREQVVSSRDPVPNMLQSLELSNGTALQGLLRQGAAAWHQRVESEGLRAIDELYLAALSRPPTDAERRLAIEYVGTPARLDGIEDLLWIICMYPEFQLVP